MSLRFLPFSFCPLHIHLLAGMNASRFWTGLTHAYSCAFYCSSYICGIHDAIITVVAINCKMNFQSLSTCRTWIHLRYSIDIQLIAYHWNLTASRNLISSISECSILLLNHLKDLRNLKSPPFNSISLTTQNNFFPLIPVMQSPPNMPGIFWFTPSSCLLTSFSSNHHGCL